MLWLAAKVSMMIMRPPPHGHGFGSTRGCSGSEGQSVWCCVAWGGTASEGAALDP
jgi:hypothetical protein